MASGTTYQATARSKKAWRLARSVLPVVGSAGFSPDDARLALSEAPREFRERIRRLTGTDEETRVRPPSDGSLGATDETWAQVVENVVETLEAR